MYCTIEILHVKRQCYEQNLGTMVYEFLDIVSLTPPPFPCSLPAYMSLQIGIVGLPNVGKSTLFSAITKKAVDCANFP